jgi:hypothetical protein
MDEERSVEIPNASPAGSGPGAAPPVETWEGRDDIIIVEDDDGAWDE